MSSQKSSKQNKKVVAIIQARLTSTRLPKKVLRKINGKTILQHVIDRVRKSSLVDKVVVASPHPIEFERADSFVLKDKEDDVLRRFYLCNCEFGGDTIVRITSDCPMIDPGEIDYAIRYFHCHSYPYVHFAPIDGLDVEVFSFNLLKEAYFRTTDKGDREHVTPYMKRKTKISVDTISDFRRVKRLMRGMEK